MWYPFVRCNPNPGNQDGWGRLVQDVGCYRPQIYDPMLATEYWFTYRDDIILAVGFRSDDRVVHRILYCTRSLIMAAYRWSGGHGVLVPLRPGNFSKETLSLLWSNPPSPGIERLAQLGPKIHMWPPSLLGNCGRSLKINKMGRFNKENGF
jgi:hypothetical protein